jgi:DNA repair protein RecN (Recombination protein N)
VLLESCEKITKGFDYSDEEIQFARARIDVYNRLISKFGRSLGDIFSHKMLCIEKIESQNFQDTKLVQLQDEFKKNLSKLRVLSADISSKRQQKKVLLEQYVLSELSDLSMPNVQFHVNLKEPANGIVLSDEVFQGLGSKELDSDWNSVRVECAKLGSLGAEVAEFKMSTNIGMELLPLDRIASGGELSRILLALKNTLFQNDEVGFFVFDEIDSGISGSVASLVGRKLFDFARNRQALCITHLAQVACFSDVHFLVSKGFSGNETKTRVELIDVDGKANQVATMICGEKISPEGLAQARKLILDAEDYKSKIIAEKLKSKFAPVESNDSPKTNKKRKLVESRGIANG